jgi:ribosomal protein S18 acetylase RimI-like enzyme
MSDLCFLPLDPSLPGRAEEIHGVMQASYRVEAGLLGVEDFPPLRRRVEEIAMAGTSFFGARSGGVLAAVAELEPTSGDSAHVNAFVVHPAFFRRGIGRALLRRLQAEPRRGRLTVSTAAANRPAIALYTSLGFQLEREWAKPFGLAMVTLAWRRGAGQEA